MPVVRFRRTAAVLGVVLLTLALGCAAEEQNPEAALLSRARTAYVAGELLKAEKLYQNYLQTYPDGAERLEAWNRVFDISSGIVGDVAAASKIADAMLMEYSRNQRVLSQMYETVAEFYAGTGQDERAVEIWNNFLDLPGLSPEKRRQARLEQFRALERLKKYAEALDALDAAAQEAPDGQSRASCLYDKAQLLLRLKRVAAAKALLEKLHTASDAGRRTRALAVFSLADILENESGQRKQALKLYESILDTYPNPKAVQARIDYLRK